MVQTIDLCEISWAKFNECMNDAIESFNCRKTYPWKFSDSKGLIAHAVNLTMPPESASRWVVRQIFAQIDWFYFDHQPTIRMHSFDDFSLFWALHVQSPHQIPFRR